MNYRLTSREVKALENAEFENSYLKGDFCLKAKLGPGIGGGTIEKLVDLGLMEIGYSEHHREDNCIRITADGERCLNGGLTFAEISEQCGDGRTFHPPRTKHWPVLEQGVFR